MEPLSHIGRVRIPMTLRLLTPDDATPLEAFLVKHRDSSMFQRANARRAGLVYREEAYHAHYMAAFRGDEIVALVAHGWNGILLLQAPEQLDEVVQACVAHSGRKVSGFIGPCDQARRARSILALNDAPTARDKDDSLYALELSELVVPTLLSSGAVVCRAPEPSERDTLCAWRVAYNMEVLGAPDSEANRRNAAGVLDAQIADGNAWVALATGELAALSAFSARLPDIVQLGGIYTPPELRGRGYARAAIAASLLSVRDGGASRAVLFSDNPSAIRCYEALGFRRISDFSLILLR